MSKRFLLGLDMDETIVDFVPAVFEEVSAKYGLYLDIKDWEDHNIDLEDYIFPKLPIFVQQLFKDSLDFFYSEILKKGFFSRLLPFKNAINVVQSLQKDYDIVIITKPSNWYSSAIEKYLWVEKYLPELKNNLIFVSNLEQKRLINVDILIDDNPKVFAGSNRHGIFVKSRRYKHCPNDEGILRLSIDNIVELPLALEKLVGGLSCKS
jgi:5'(3')-deoxyribonucleotidase